MDTRELLRTLSSCKFHQKYVNPEKPKIERKTYPSVNWKERKEMKNKVFVKHLKIFFGLVIFYHLFVSVPFLLAYTPYAMIAALAMPPMALITLSWMAAAWWAWDKDRFIFFAVTLGAVPLRLGLALLYAVICLSIPNINPQLFAIALMINWILFTIAEFAMVLDFGKKFPPVNEIEQI